MLVNIIKAVTKSYPEIVPYLTGRALRIATKAVNAPDDDERVKMEKKIKALIEARLKAILEELTGYAADGNQPPADFWVQMEASLYNTLLDPLTAAASNGVTNTISDNPGFGVSWDIVNNDAIKWAEQNTAEIVKSISNTSMEAFQSNFRDWVESGKPLDDLITSLEPYYGDVKASQVAVTETTRAYAAGNLAVWRNSGVVNQFNVFTAEDDIVCPICSGQESDNPHNINAEHPPFHVNCRCWIQPIVREL